MKPVSQHKKTAKLINV